MILAAAAAGGSAETFTGLMDHVAQGFEALGAAILIVGVIWSFVLAVVATRRSGWSAKAYLVLRQAFTCQVAGPLPVQRGAGPVGLAPEQVERAGHVHVVEPVFRQATVARTPSAVAGVLLHVALYAVASLVIIL